jgi:hypothetical protein
MKLPDELVDRKQKIVDAAAQVDRDLAAGVPLGEAIAREQAAIEKLDEVKE